MSAAITMTGVTGDPTLTRLIQDSQTIHNRLDKLTDQASTGLIADNYAGLGSGASVSLDLHPQIANLQTWQNNVDAATGRMSVAQSDADPDSVDRREFLRAAQQSVASATR